MSSIIPAVAPLARPCEPGTEASQWGDSRVKRQRSPFRTIATDIMAETAPRGPRKSSIRMSLPVSRKSAAVTRIPHSATRLSERSRIVFGLSAMDRKLPKTSPQMRPTSPILGPKTSGSSPEPEAPTSRTAAGTPHARGHRPVAAVSEQPVPCLRRRTILTEQLRAGLYQAQRADVKTKTAAAGLGARNEVQRASCRTKAAKEKRS